MSILSATRSSLQAPLFALCIALLAPALIPGPGRPAACAKALLEAPASRRQVLLFGRVDAELARDVAEQLLDLDQESHEEIDLLINSTGGSIGDARAILSVFQLIESPVNTVCMGYAWSSAATILAGGTGARQAFEHTSVMIHELSWEDSGRISALETTARQGRRDNDLEVSLLARFSGRDPDLIRRDMRQDFYLSASEARDYGLIDSVLPLKGGKHR